MYSPELTKEIEVYTQMRFSLKSEFKEHNKLCKTHGCEMRKHFSRTLNAMDVLKEKYLSSFNKFHCIQNKLKKNIPLQEDDVICNLIFHLYALEYKIRKIMGNFQKSLIILTRYFLLYFKADQN